MLPFLRMLLPKREEKSPTTQVEQVEPMSCPGTSIFFSGAKELITDLIFLASAHWSRRGLESSPYLLVR